MKKILTILALASAAATGCKKECDTRKPAACKDVPPTQELCNAVFSRWFYNAQTGQCQFVSYSGCSQKGFATQQECERCVKSAR